MMTNLGKYELNRKLGEGVTAEVYLVSEQVLQREVALKVLKLALVADTASFERSVCGAGQCEVADYPCESRMGARRIMVK